MNKKLFFESSLITILVFIVLWVFYLLISISFEPFNYVVGSIKEIDLNDLYFSSLDNTNIEENVIVINIEDIDRYGINEVVSKVAEAGPSVIGLDVFFSHYKTTPWDSQLRNTLNDLGDKVVMVANYYEDGREDNSYWKLSNCTYGHAGVITTKDKTGVVREFEPSIGSDDMYSFASMLASKYNSSSYDRLIERDNDKETIHYIGNIGAFRVINYRDILIDDSNKLSLLNDKIVILGFCGDSTQQMVDFTDTYYTPVGASMSANRLPDMYGVMIHANITSMIINDRYISNVPNWIVYLLTFLITYFIVLIFTYLFLNQPIYFNVGSKLIQLLGLFLLLWIVFLLFSFFHLNFTTSFLIIAVIIAVDVLFLYEFLAILVYKNFKIKSLFIADPKM